MSGAVSGILAPQPLAGTAVALDPKGDRAVPLAAFLDRVAAVLRTGLPAQVWLSATVIDARASASGHTLELSDPALQRTATLRVFLPAASLVAIRRDLGVPIDPALLIGMTTFILISPQFSRRWHLGGRVEGLSRDAAAGLRARMLERVVATLKREVIWDRQHALPRPRDITRLAVIHPAEAAGWGDVRGELGRWEQAGLVHVRSHPTAFEGETAAAAIVAALRAAAQPIEGHPPDLILLVRGGGARMSLVALDEEIVARAILACTVPVVCGTGHAQDRTLADQVAWRASHTPSKALGLVAALIAATARKAISDRNGILSIATTVTATHMAALEAKQQVVIAAAARAVAAADYDLLRLWSSLRDEMRAFAERKRRADGDLAQLLNSVLSRAPQIIDAAGHKLHRLVQTTHGHGAAMLHRLDAGAAAFARVVARAEALLERERAALQRHHADVEAQARRQSDQMDAGVDSSMAEIEAADLGRLMARGFVIVTDTAGHALSTCAAATGHLSLQLHFGDGILTVAPRD